MMMSGVECSTEKTVVFTLLCHTWNLVNEWESLPSTRHMASGSIWSSTDLYFVSLFAIISQLVPQFPATEQGNENLESGSVGSRCRPVVFYGVTKTLNACFTHL